MSLKAIESLLSRKIGVDAQVSGRKIARAAEVRCSACGLPDLDAYFRVLQTSPQELEELVEQVIVPETYFFRDRKPFDFLVNHVRSNWLSPSSRSPSSRTNRLLSVPCSSGEEPYSMAISLIEAGLRTDRFSIDAIDISKRAIAKAQRAIYGKNSFRGQDWSDRSRYFQQTAEGYEVISSVRRVVNFRQGNLLNACAMTQVKYDIIFCRNLSIYLESAACIQIFNILHSLLLPQGLLFVGASETGKIPRDRFTSIRQHFTFAYQKVESDRLSTSPHTLSLLPLKEEEKILAPLSTRRTTSEPVDATQSTVREVVSLQSDASLELARQLADSGQVVAAIEHCKEYLERDLTNAEAHALLGTLYQSKAENDWAERCFRKALYLNPNCYEALIHLALLKEYSGDSVSAEILQQRIQKLQKTPQFLK